MTERDGLLEHREEESAQDNPPSLRGEVDEVTCRAFRTRPQRTYEKWRLPWAAAGLGGLLLLSLLLPLPRPGHRSGVPAAAAKANAGATVSFVGPAAWTNIRWKRHPTKCLDVGGTRPGAALQVWDCDPNYPYQQQFFVPRDGTVGKIKWAQKPDLCLDTPGNTQLQFWPCNKAPSKSLLFSVSPDGKGRIHWAAHPDQCIDVPNGGLKNGWKVKLYSCSNKSEIGGDGDRMFWTHPVDCKWDGWEAWGGCSATCGGGHHKRSRSKLIRARSGGKDCSGKQHESRSCNNHPCASHSASTPRDHLTTTALLVKDDNSRDDPDAHEETHWGFASRPGGPWALMSVLVAISAQPAIMG